MSGVSVVGVSEPGPKNVSRPSPITCAGSVISGRLGARVFVRFGRPLTRCCSWNDALGSSVIESQLPSSSSSSSSSAPKLAARLPPTALPLPAVAFFVVGVTAPPTVAPLEAFELRREPGESSSVGRWLRLRFSTTDCGRILWANVRRLFCSIGVACRGSGETTRLIVANDCVIGCWRNGDGIGAYLQGLNIPISV